ncbi:exosortase A [Photobacterium galatheae]|uniref:Uncharacterized protein n=1 Tax=Photobacterium galatheae TaxID=1654360 RepID=A0A066RNT5_9GAMM|nr:exosortase A [Photobacterium galatheae]KDM90751.1 hypothetical protein EA58_15300 [Photobacterium galatheae]MCM0149920.1 exosortase A [Photobacterium galatheae]
MVDRIWFRLTFPLIAWLWLYWPSLSHMVTVWMNSKTYEHCFLILPISLWLVWREKATILKTPLTVSWIAAGLLIIPSLIWLIGRAAGFGLFEHLAAILSLQLLLWAVLGTAIARQLWFPLLYLLFAVPFGDSLIPRLQMITADLSVWLLNLSDIPVYREGLYLTIPNGRFFVAEACSGIRFLMSSVALGTLFAYLQFTKTYKRIFFVAFSFVFPIIANGIRAYGIVLIGYWSDMKYAAGADHLIYGWVFFSLIILVIFFTASLFSDAERPPSSPSASETPTPPRQQWGVFGSIALLLSITAFWNLQLSQHLSPTTQTNTTFQASQTETLSAWGITFPYAQTHQRQTTADGKAEIFTARYNIWQQDGELISSLNQLFNKETWSLKTIQPVNLASGVRARTMTVANASGGTMHVLYWYCVNDFCSSHPLAIKLVKASYRLAGQQGFSDVFAIASSELNDTEILRIAEQNNGILAAKNQ